MGTFLFNLSHSIVALQAKRVVSRITSLRSTCLATNFRVASCSNMLHKVEPSSTFCNKFFQLETMLAFKQMRIILFQTGIFISFCRICLCN